MNPDEDTGVDAPLAKPRTCGDEPARTLRTYGIQLKTPHMRG